MACQREAAQILVAIAIALGQSGQLVNALYAPLEP